MSSEPETNKSKSHSHLPGILYDLFVISVVIISSAGFLCYFGHYEPRTWGEEGNLEIEITLDKATISENESFNSTITLTNNGTSMVRVLPTKLFSTRKLLIVTDANGTIMKGTLPYAMMPELENSDLLVLEPGEYTKQTREISWISYELMAGHTYTIQGEYDPQDYGSIDLPYWKGTILSNNVTVTVM